MCDDQCAMATTMAPATGSWSLSTGGDMAYCSKGHFTKGPTWKFWVGLVAKMTVCDECAKKEAA